MSEENKQDIYDQHMKRLEKKVKILVVAFIAMIAYIVWFMMHQ